MMSIRSSFEDGITRSGELIAWYFAALQLLDRRFNVLKDAAVFLLKAANVLGKGGEFCFRVLRRVMVEALQGVTMIS
jgi:hypothetical protein